ncbi:MAG: hypothetical protein EB166_03885 [Thaumarchaeota archaeon]|nr:hypothetical protein [Nitrososphaerota archaeon]
MKSAIIFSIVIAAGLILLQASMPQADAVKSLGTKNQPFGKHSQIQVCGTYFCTSDPSLGGKVNPEKNKPTQDDFNAVLNRMDKVHKQHQQKMLEQWRLMDNTQRIQFLHVVDQMLTEMESLDMGEHIKEMMSESGPVHHGYMYGDKMHDPMKHDSKDNYEDNEEYDSEESDN